MNIWSTTYWSIWLAMLVIGDPLWIHFGGEKASDTHMLSEYIPIGIRAGILGWLAYHFLVAHIKG